jgi:integrase/recombinase XerD
MRKLPKVLSKDEIDLLFQRAKSERDKVLLMTLYYLGLRVSEAIHARVEDFDLKGGVFKVIKGKDTSGGGGKDRLVPIPDVLKKEMLIYLKMYNKQEGDSLFGLKSRQSATHICKALRNDIHPHMLRHSYATHVYDKTGNLLAVKELLGHESISTTQIYTHLSGEQKKKLIDNVF